MDSSDNVNEVTSRKHEPTTQCSSTRPRRAVSNIKTITSLTECDATSSDDNEPKRSRSVKSKSKSKNKKPTRSVSSSLVKNATCRNERHSSKNDVTSGKIGSSDVSLAVATKKPNASKDPEDRKQVTSVTKKKKSNPDIDDSQILSEIWSLQLFERLLQSETVRSIYNRDKASFAHEIKISTIGIPLWSDDWSQDNSILTSSDDMKISNICNNENPIEGRQFCVEISQADSMLKDTISDQTAITDTIPPNTIRRRPVRATVVAAAAAAANALQESSVMDSTELALQLSQARDNGDADAHILVAPQLYPKPGICPCLSGDALAEAVRHQQPFEVFVHPQVSFLCDIHAHLSQSEVIGLLAGRWDVSNRILYIQCAVPCAALDQIDGGKTDVELDPISAITATESIIAMNLVVVGWYHSHPKFCPNPSVTDIHNQQQYQHQWRDESSDLEPFVGLIVSTFDKASSVLTSRHQWFHVRKYDVSEDTNKDKRLHELKPSKRHDISIRPIYLPMMITVKQRVIPGSISSSSSSSSSTMTSALGSLQSSCRAYLEDEVLSTVLRQVLSDMKDEPEKESVRMNLDTDVDLDVDISSANEPTPSTAMDTNQHEAPTATHVDLTADKAEEEEEEVTVLVLAPVEDDDATGNECSSSTIVCGEDSPVVQSQLVVDEVSDTAAPPVEEVATRLRLRPARTTKPNSFLMEFDQGFKPRQSRKRTSNALVVEDPPNAVVSKTTSKELKPVARRRRRQSSKLEKSEDVIEDAPALVMDSDASTTKQVQLESKNVTRNGNSNITGMSTTTMTTATPTTTVRYALLARLQDGSEAAEQACALLCSASAPLRPLVLSVVCLALYYRVFQHRTNFNDNWRGVSKAEKLKTSALVWAKALMPLESDCDSLLTDMMELISLCWKLPRAVRR